LENDVSGKGWLLCRIKI